MHAGTKPHQGKNLVTGERVFVLSPANPHRIKEKSGCGYDGTSGAPIFANGAETSLFQAVFNQLAHSDIYSGSSPGGQGASGSPVSDGIIGQMAGDGYGPPAPFSTIDAAARAGLAEADPLGRTYEYAGAVIAAGGGYYATNPVTTYQQHDFAFTLPAGVSPIALYHTHPLDTNSDSFSRRDVDVAKGFGVKSYIGVYATDSIRYFDPSTMNGVSTRNFGSGTSMVGTARGEVLCTNCFH